MKPNYYTGEEESNLDAVYDHLDEITDLDDLQMLRDDIDRRIKTLIAMTHISNIRAAIRDAHAAGLSIQFVDCGTFKTFDIDNSNYCILVK